MTEPVTETIAIANAEKERLRQERETFNQRKDQDARYLEEIQNGHGLDSSGELSACNRSNVWMDNFP